MRLWWFRTGCCSEGEPCPGPGGTWGASRGERRGRCRGGWSSGSLSSSCSRAKARRLMKGPTPSSSEATWSVWSAGPSPWAPAAVAGSWGGGGGIVEARERGVVWAEVGVVSVLPAVTARGECSSGWTRWSAASTVRAASSAVRWKRWQNWRHRLAAAESRRHAQVRWPMWLRAPCAKPPMATVPVPSRPALSFVHDQMWWRTVWTCWLSWPQAASGGR